MSARFDVAARLDEGRPAVEHTQSYVQACHVLGYQHPDLTAHPSQVHDWYDTEAGLDLRVLDDDSAALRAAANTVDEAMWLQREQVTTIAAAWSGSGADSATQFLLRHCGTGAEVAAHVRAAADGYAALRDRLWQLVDGKVETAVAIDDRKPGERPAWLAAAQTVTGGTGDRSTAEELILQQVMPYVDNNIRVDWLDAMRSNAASVETAYDAAIDALSSMGEVRFAIPGELGPSRQPVFDETVGPNPIAAALPETSPPVIAPTVPAAASAPPPPREPPSAPGPGALDDLPSLPSALTSPLGDAGGLSSGTGGFGGLAGSIGGIVGGIVDAVGGLLSSLGIGATDPTQSGDALLDDALDDDNPLGDDGMDGVDGNDSPDAEPVSTDADASEPPENASAPVEPVSEPAAQQVAPQPDAPPPPAAPPPAGPPSAAPPPEPSPDGKTACEIAEDELPQAGQ